jgi:hypothetical protein
VKRLKRIAPAALAFMAGCAGPYDDPSTTTYVLGAIFVIIGIALGVALVMGLNSD